MSFTVIAQTPAMARELARHEAAGRKARLKEIRRARREQGQGRYLVIDAGFPALRYLLWDAKREDSLRGQQLPGNPRHPWYSSKAKALRIADALSRADEQSRSLSYGVACLECGEWETACTCPDDSPVIENHCEVCEEYESECTCGEA